MWPHMQLLGLAEAKRTWFYGLTGSIAAALLALNVLLLVAVHARRLRQSVRSSRARETRARIDEALAGLDAPARDDGWLRTHVDRFDELERPLAAVALIERLRPLGVEERARTLETLREVGAIDLLLRSTRGRLPWRRALAIRTLGWAGAGEAVPVLLERLSDRSRHVRESAVRALGRIGDPSALPPLEQLFVAPGRVGAGAVYDALRAFGAPARPVFAGALGSHDQTVRVASCFGVAAVEEPDAARALLEPLLADPAARVRAAAATALRGVGGTRVPAGLADAARDGEASVRVAATEALGSFDDPGAVALALGALRDPDRDTALRAAEALVRLSRRPAAGPAAAAALRTAAAEWPVERAAVLASVGAV